MGAGASVEAGGAMSDASKGTDMALEGLEVVEKGATDVGQGISEVDETSAGAALAAVVKDEGANIIGSAAVVAGEAAGAEVEAFLASIEDEDVAGQAGAMISLASEVMTADEVRDAVGIIRDGAGVPGVETSDLLLRIGGALNEASNMAPAVVDCVTGSLINIGPHLPIIGIAAGALGALAAAYVKAKEDDETIKTFVIWCGGIKDWLVLVAGRVGKSGGENTVALFEELKAGMLELKNMLDTQTKRGFITKMLTTTTFNRKFQDVKGKVTALKTALTDYLDPLSQDKQEAMLADIQASNLRVEEKVGAMSDDVTQIKAMLEASLAANAKSDTEKAMDASEEERLYAMMQSNVMLKPDEAITFKQLVMNVQTLLFKNQKLPAEMQRGLKISADEENTGKVTKLQFIGFYRSWQESGQSVDEFLLSVADANPTLFAVAMDGAARASMLMGAGALKLSDKYSKYGSMATDAANAAADVAANAANAAGAAMAGMAGMAGVSEKMKPSLGNLTGGKVLQGGE